ncbi:MAG: AMP-binding protein [Pseudomonadota bacterium]
MTTLGGMLRSNGQVHAARTAIRDGAGLLRWDAYVDRIARTAGALRQAGLAPGERFAILARNSVAQAQLINAGYWSGTVPVPLNFRLAPAEIAQLLDDADCRLLFVDTAFAPLLDDPLLQAWRARTILLPLGTAGVADAAAAEDPWQARWAAAAALPLHAGHEDDDALLLYTGGTTGRGKGVRLSHRNILSNALQLARVMGAGAEDVYLHVAPMFHSTDLKSTVVSLFGGAHVYLPDFSAEGVLRAAQDHGVTILSLVPAMVARVLEGARPQDYALPRLRLLSYGSSPMDEGLLRRAMEAFGGVGFHQCYGLTETAPFIAILDEATHRRAVDSRPDLLRAAGHPLPATELRFVDDAGHDVPSGAEGEIVVRGPQLARGYLNRPDDEAAAWRGGWFHTGDVGRLDGEGLLHVLGRKKDMVITGGENVYTREVEAALLLHPRVAEAAVVGVPDAAYGEALLAVLVVAPGRETPCPQDLIAFCRTHLGGFKVPRQYRFVAELPRTALGKVRKHELVAAHLASLGAQAPPGASPATPVTAAAP